MAHETLNAIKNAETNATKLESQSLKEHDSILLRAEEQARSIISTKEKEALKISMEEMEKAKKLGDNMIQMSIDEGRMKKEKLLEQAQKNEKSTIEYILYHVV